MRNNGPVTSREVLLPDNEMLVSRTDPGGRIGFCNAEFVRISGFPEEELIGAPHNLVRHPDMPREAFRNLWETIKAGRVWEGLVKNRTKAGDFYWVRANVTPVVEGGKVQGYVSIRVKPDQAEVAAAEAAYARIRAGEGRGIGLRQGAIVALSPAARLGRVWRSVGGRLGLAGLGFVATLAAVDALSAAGAGPGVELAVSALGLGACGTMGLLAMRLLSASLREMERRFDQIAAGDYHAAIPPAPAAEFEDVTMRLRGLRARLGYAVQERTESERRAAEARQAAIQEMAGRIEDAVRDAIGEIGTRTAAMACEAEGMAAAVAQLHRGAEGAAEGAGLAHENVQAVAAATEELAASVREITGQAARAGTATRLAVDQSRETEGTIRSLAAALGKVEEVVTLIRRIAEQTNLLALNASIEAARAGEAGKGFAVVAGEVKNLATQTARSTEEITRHIGDILSVSRQAVEAVEGVGRLIAEIFGVSSSIAAAMEQQAAATQEIARNVTGSSTAVQQVSGRMEELRGAAGEAGRLAEQVHGGTQGVDHAVAGMREALVRLVRSSMVEADRRAENRHAVEQPCQAEVAGARQEGTLRDASPGGCLVEGLAGAGPGTLVALAVPGWGVRGRFRVVEVSARGHHLALEPGADGSWAMAVQGVRGRDLARAA